jgi:hypothetical protein
VWSKCLEFINQERTVDSFSSLQIFHQTITGLRSKTDEVINSLEINNVYPHVLCFSEHHMEEQDLLHLALPGFMLGSSLCRQNLPKGVCVLLFIGTCISAKLIFHITVKKKDLEIFAVGLETK